MAIIKEISPDKEASTSNDIPVVRGIAHTDPSESEFSDTSSEDDDLDESDKELQIAFQKGYIKPGLNVVQHVVKKKWINNASALKTKLVDLKNKLDWIERLDVTVDRRKDDNENAANENDFKREVSFINQAQDCIAVALPKLRKLGVATKRPNDYFAEMFKSDEHMKKVRGKLLDMQHSKEKSEVARRIRQERKFAARIQKDVAVERQQEKKMLSDAVKKHKKGAKDQFEKLMGDNDSKEHRKSKKRSIKDQKYGHGGQKKRAKWNTAESSADMSGFDARKFSSKANKPQQRGRFAGKPKKAGKKKQQRPGKNRRNNMKNKRKVKR